MYLLTNKVFPPHKVNYDYKFSLALKNTDAANPTPTMALSTLILCVLIDFNILP